MKIHRLLCPQCGEPAIGTVERLSGRAEFTPVADDGTTEYSGWTEIWWEEQKTVYQHDEAPESADNLPLVICANGHNWPTPIDW